MHRSQNASKTVFSRYGLVSSQFSNVYLFIFFFLSLRSVYLLQFFFYTDLSCDRKVCYLTAPVYTCGSFTTINHSASCGEDIHTNGISLDPGGRTLATGRGKGPAAHYQRSTLYCNNFFFFFIYFNQYFRPLRGL